MNRMLWVVQIMLALLFLFAGGSKLWMPAAELTAQSPMPAWFLRFIGSMEILGGLGLVLPGLLRMYVWLAPLAAAGLSLIMLGALVVTVQTMGVGMAALPLVTGVLTVLVAFGRWRVTPHSTQRS